MCKGADLQSDTEVQRVWLPGSAAPQVVRSDPLHGVVSSHQTQAFDCESSRRSIPDAVLRSNYWNFNTIGRTFCFQIYSSIASKEAEGVLLEESKSDVF